MFIPASYPKTTQVSRSIARAVVMLLNQPGEMVSREDLRKVLWPNDTVVEFEHSINAAVQRLRDAPCVDIFSPAKQASKQRDSLSGTVLLVHRLRRLNGFGWRRILWPQLRNRNAVNRQKPPQASILLPEADVFLLWRLELKRF
jgi:hypothetical protein